MCTKVCPDRIFGVSVILFRVGHQSLFQGMLTHASRKASDPCGNSVDGGSVAVLKGEIPCYLLKEWIAAACANKL